MAASAVSGGSDSAEEIVVMTPFVVEADEDRGYMAASTLAGTRIRTDLPDAVSANSTRSSETPQNADPAGNRDLRFPAAKAEVGGLSGTSALSPSSPGITLQPWSQESGYIDHLRRRPAPARYAAYIEERTDHLLDAGFYLDVAQFFFEEKDSALGLRILSNLAELQLEDAPLLRILAHRLLQANRPELAVPLFERVMKIRSEEPQSRRDLALACASTHQYQRAVDLLWEIVEKRWSERFPQIELMALGELNAIAATCGRNLDLSKVDPRLRRNLAVGLRAVLTWDSDNCDIDLWVDDPNGERAIYSNNRTVQGGRMSCDFTGGYGPEEFLLKQPMPGKYTVRINYFGDRRTTALGPVTAQVRLITGFGTSEQKEQSLSVRLASSSQTLVIGSIDIPAP
jgi:hypothetical protein